MSYLRPISAVVCILAVILTTVDATLADRSQRSTAEVWRMYEFWLTSHGKYHGTLGEKRTRFEVFADNLRFIDEHNEDENATYMLELNRFADLTNEEYRKMYLGVKGGITRRNRGRRLGEMV